MIVLAYFAVALLVWPLLARLSLALLMDGAHYEPDFEDLVPATIMGGCAAIVWPLMAPAALVLHFLRSSEVKT